MSGAAVEALPSCPYCGKALKYLRGVESHIAQTPACQLARNRDLENQNGADNEFMDEDNCPQDGTDDLSVDRSNGTASPSEDTPRLSPPPAGTASPPPIPLPKYHIHTVPGAAHRGEKEGTHWETKHSNENPAFPFYPWASEAEYNLVAWLTLSKLSAAAIDQFIHLEFVCTTNYYSDA